MALFEDVEAFISQGTYDNVHSTELLSKHNNPDSERGTSVPRYTEQLIELHKDVLVLVDLFLDLYSHVCVVQIPSSLQISIADATERAKRFLELVFLDQPAQFVSCKCRSEFKLMEHTDHLGDSGQKYTWAQTITGRTTVEPSISRQLRLFGKLPKATPMRFPSMMPLSSRLRSENVSAEGFTHTYRKQSKLAIA